ncbi:MAG: hypothetical protein OEX01_04400 [Candidatus Bathyarchaeota archaeon]|nr:hypothetical protein [Candidatus Bathyarchaeota archaeon]
MRNEWLVFGIILLFVGLIVTSAAVSSQQEKVVSRDDVDKKLDLLTNATFWWIAGNFSKGRRLYLSMQPGPGWTAEPPSVYEMYLLKVPVTITDPHGEETRLFAIFGTDPKSTQSDVVRFWGVNLTSNDGGLIFEKSNEFQMVGITYYQEISAIVTIDGVYNATVNRNIGVWSPPSILLLQSLLIENEYPYWFVIPIGIALMIAGVSLSIWVTKHPKH